MQGLLKELDSVDHSVLKQVYKYKINEQQQDKEDAKRITRDYKMNYMDPTQYIVKLTKQNAWRNAAKMKLINRHKKR